MRGRAPLRGLALAALASLLAACTETPDDLPECVGPGSYCPSLDGGDEASDAALDADEAATASHASDAGNDG